jgi:TonB family protein
MISACLPRHRAVAYLFLVRSMNVSRAVLFFGLSLSALGSARAQAVTTGSPRGAIVYATYAIKPDYPVLAEVRHMQGSGVFQLHIRADGTVSSVDMIQSTGYFELNEVSIGAFSKWRFRPPGRPTKVKIPIRFSAFGAH